MHQNEHFHRQNLNIFCVGLPRLPLVQSATNRSERLLDRPS